MITFNLRFVYFVGDNDSGDTPAGTGVPPSQDWGTPLKEILLVFRVRCGTTNSNQTEECECVVKFPLIHFNILTYGYSGYVILLSTRKSSCVNARGIPPARGRKMLTPPLAGPDPPQLD